MFHHFHGPGHPAGQGSLDAAAFGALLDHLEGRLLPARHFLSQTGKLALTFDDNLGCQYEVALPVLRERGLTAFWFVYTGPLQGRLERLEIYRAFRTRYPSIDAFYDAFFAGKDRAELLHGFPSTYLAEWSFYTHADREFRYVRDEVLGPERYHAAMEELIASSGTTLEELARGLWMSPHQLVELHAEGHVIGLHSHTHPTRMATLEPKEQRREYATCQEILAGLLGERATSMSHPCNSYSPETLKILTGLGVKIGFRSNDQLEGGPLERPRLDHTLV